MGQKPPVVTPGRPRWRQPPNPLSVVTLVYMEYGRQGILDMIRAVKDYEDRWLKPLIDESGSDPRIKKEPPWIDSND